MTTLFRFARNSVFPFLGSHLDPVVFHHLCHQYLAVHLEDLCLHLVELMSLVLDYSTNVPGNVKLASRRRCVKVLRLLERGGKTLWDLNILLGMGDRHSSPLEIESRALLLIRLFRAGRLNLHHLGLRQLSNRMMELPGRA